MRHALLMTAVLALAGPAWADDLTPPPWDRGDPSATFQEWRFDNPPAAGTIYPEIDDNQFGDPSILDPYWPGDSSYLPEWDGRDGVWNPYNDFWIDLPNDPAELPLKDIYLQITWNLFTDQGRDAEYPIPEVYMPGAPYTNEVGLVDEYPLDSNWMYSRWHIQIWPNPEFESLYFPGGMSEYFIDQIVVDTICIPEPASLTILALASLVLVRRR